MSIDLKNKTAFITGAAHGQGRASAGADRRLRQLHQLRPRHQRCDDRPDGLARHARMTVPAVAALEMADLLERLHICPEKI